MSLSKINSVENSTSSFTAVRSGTFKKAKPVESKQKNTKCLGSSLKERHKTSNDIVELIELKEFLDSINLGKHFNTFVEEEIAFKDLVNKMSICILIYKNMLNPMFILISSLS